MNGSTQYLGNLINQYKNLTLEQQRENFETRIKLGWDYWDQRQMKNIAKEHGISLRLLVRIILEDFLESRKNYTKIRDKINGIWDRYERSLE